MAKDEIRYDLQVQTALKGVMRKVLADAAREGLPGEHHFFISFKTVAPGVKLSQRFRDEYPEEMTIVLQHQFWDLNVTEQFFEVGLSFKGIPERLHIPFEAITGFFDPSVQFGLKFEVNDEPAVEMPTPLSPVGGELETTSLTSRRPSVPAIPKLREAKAESKPGDPKPGEAKDARSGDEKPAKGKGAQAGKAAKSAAPSPAAAGEDEAGATVVSLDAFRKK